MKLTKNQQYLVAAGSALVLVALVVGAFFLGKGTNEPMATEDESTATAEATWTVESTPAAEASEPKAEVVAPDVPPVEPLPSYKRYARIKGVGGIPGNYTIDVDFFDIYTEGEAEQFAASHGLTVPGNGILYVDEDATLETVPLRTDVVIIYKVGGVESLELKYATVEQLKEWAKGNTDIFDTPYDQWQITVDQGLVTKIEMVVVAD